MGLKILVQRKETRNMRGSQPEAEWYYINVIISYIIYGIMLYYVILPYVISHYFVLCYTVSYYMRCCHVGRVTCYFVSSYVM